MTRKIVLFAAATAESQILRINETTKRGIKSQCIIGELRSLPSATTENVETKCSDVNPKVSRLRQNALEKNIKASFLSLLRNGGSASQ